MLDKNKVVIGMSGGVDSSVAAYLLKKQGYDVIGVTMKLWQGKGYDDREDTCCGLSAVEDARLVCNKLDIPFYVMNFKSTFKEKVVDYFLDEYLEGRTPNPCIACNKYLKFDKLLQKAHELGAYYVATGHYARIEEDKDGRYSLKKSSANTKDQTYALYNFTQEQLKHTLMPLSEFETKAEVREIAEEAALIVAGKPDSQEICFVPEDDYAGFIKDYAVKEIKPGNFVDKDGNILGKHKGIIHYTIGQRKGLGLSLGAPGYVIKIEAKKNEVVIGENSDIFKTTLVANNINLIPYDRIEEPIRVEAKIRYAAKPAKATLTQIKDDLVKVEFDDAQRAITPGQAVVFYQGENLIGGGTIL